MYVIILKNSINFKFGNVLRLGLAYRIWKGMDYADTELDRKEGRYQS